jgi:putative SOS response-associated peptidase YedK
MTLSDPGSFPDTHEGVRSPISVCGVCGRYSNTTKKTDEIHTRMAELLGVSQPESDRGFERFNIAPTQEVLAVVADQRDRRIAELRWGLIPRWAKEPKQGFKMINARAETVLERPAYRGLVQRAHHRCLVLADGWYEWQRPEDPKQPRRPVHFSRPGGEPFYFAALWTSWSSPEGGVVPSCTIITCQANEIARPIHDRMPVVLADPAEWEAWLDPGLDGRGVQELLEPLRSGRLSVSRANPVVNSARHEGPDCLEPDLVLH